MAGPPPPPPAKGGPAVPPPTGGPAVPPPSGPVAAPSNPDGAATGVLAEAEDKYKAEDYQGAAVIFHAVASGKTPGDKSRAQFWLGKSLYKLQYYAVSLAVFSEIVTAGPSHPYHKLTLPWLASLSRELPEGAGVLEKVGTYKATELEDSAFDEVRDELYYLLGRFNYQKGDLGQAIALLGQVPDNSDYYIPAQFFLGVAETREFHGPQAVEAFKNVLRKNISLKESWAKDKKKRKKEAKAKAKLAKKNKKKQLAGEVEELSFEEEMQRYEERANLALGYIFYQVGKYDTALKYYDKIRSSRPTGSTRSSRRRGRSSAWSRWSRSRRTSTTSARSGTSTRSTRRSSTTTCTRSRSSSRRSRTTSTAATSPRSCRSRSSTASTRRPAMTSRTCSPRRPRTSRCSTSA
ncbi:tetratricopeptide repeat protein [Nannocystis pusilla]|uniref:tetratricopeptide repeat protein n=1 Tax=Nannocystis pusilla TaxID=889268 RepID=UPI003B787504